MMNLPAFTPGSLPVFAANDRYGEMTVGGLKTARIGRDGLAQMMLADCLKARITNAHPKLVAVLSNETQYIPDARLTDEVYLFFFKSEPLFVRTFDDVEDFSNFGAAMPFTKSRLPLTRRKPSPNF